MQLSERQIILKMYSLTKNVFRLNVFTTYFAQSQYLLRPVWYPVIEQQNVVQEVVISAKYNKTKRKVLIKTAQCI